MAGELAFPKGVVIMTIIFVSFFIPIQLLFLWNLLMIWFFYSLFICPPGRFVYEIPLRLLPGRDPRGTRTVQCVRRL